jgi:hypothetical protein
MQVIVYFIQGIFIVQIVSINGVKEILLIAHCAEPKSRRIEELMEE